MFTKEEIFEQIGFEEYQVRFTRIMENLKKTHYSSLDEMDRSILLIYGKEVIERSFCKAQFHELQQCTRANGMNYKACQAATSAYNTCISSKRLQVFTFLVEKSRALCPEEGRVWNDCLSKYKNDPQQQKNECQGIEQNTLCCGVSQILSKAFTDARHRSYA